MISRRVVLTAAREFQLTYFDLLTCWRLLVTIRDLDLVNHAHSLFSWCPCLPSHSPSLRKDCVDKDGVFNGQNKVIKLNMYSYDDQDGVVTIPLCSIEGGGGDGDCTDLAYAIRHENFNGVLNGNDFALIILPNTSEVVEGVLAEISPVKLNSDANVPADGDDFETFGWGRISTDDEVAPPKIPNTVFLKYLEDEQECEERMVAGGGIAFEVSTSMLCTIGDGTTSAYRGDSGMRI